MRARLIESHKFTLEDGGIIEIKVWELPHRTAERAHGLKYSLFFGYRGERVVGYDNETGKGDHRHYRDREEAYHFTTFERLLSDFWKDVMRAVAK
jgi:hypothetical protein